MSTEANAADVRGKLVRSATGIVVEQISARRKSFAAGVARLNQSLDVVQVGHTQQDDAIAVHVSKTGYVVFWVLVFLARCCCIVFLLGTTRVYWFVAHPYMSYYASLLGPQAVEQFKPIGICFGLVAVAHGFELLRMLIHSCRLRRLVLDAPPTHKRPHHHNSTLVESFNTSPNFFTLCLRRIAWSSQAKWEKLFHRRGFFGVESDFFHARFLSREIVEIVSQTAQVYNSSLLIAKVWINNLYVGIIIVNCCSTPVLQAVYRNSPALERLLCLCVDFFLDAAVSVIVPIIILEPYYRKFDFENYNFEIAYLYDDIWFANMVMENQQIFALTTWDFVWKIVPHLSMFSCLNSLNALIRPGQCSVVASSANSQVFSQAWSTHFSNHSTRSDRSSRAVTPIDQIVPDPVATSREDNKAKSERPVEVPVTLPRKRIRVWKRKQSTRQMRTKGEKLVKAINVGMLLWGLGILTLHIMAIRTSLSVDVPGCKQVTRPWFASNFSCSVLQYNCHQYNTSDVRLQDLEILQEESVAALVFSHCTDLHVPAHIRKFRNLLGVDIFNSTLVEWSADAAITNVTHPKLTYIIFVHVNMTQLPEGVLQQLPSSMTDFEISVSNLSRLPDDLDERWHPMSVFYVEHSHIREFPAALLHLHVDDLSLIGNFISEIPELPSGHGGFFTLAMTHTPLTRLPENIGDIETIGFLNLGYTELSSFPSWMNSVAKTATKVYVHHTPFCNQKTDEEIASHYGTTAVLTCTEDGDRQDGKYPLALMETRRPYEPASSGG